MHRPPFAYTETFEKMFPFYLAIGMTPEQYWDDDPWLCKAYREAFDMKQEHENQMLWLQGMYLYDALIRLAPIFNPFSKRGTRPQPYPEQPYPLTNKQKETKQEKEARKNYEKIKAKLTAFAVRHNQNMKKGDEKNADNDRCSIAASNSQQ